MSQAKTPKLNRAMVAAKLAEATRGISRNDAEVILKHLESIITENVRKGVDVHLSIGVFRRKHSPARTAHNPQTGEPVQVPARMKVVFKPSKAFKNVVLG